MEAELSNGASPTQEGSASDGHDDFKAFELAGWGERAVTYTRLVARVTAKVAEPLLDAAGVGERSRVLDVGTGPGDIAAAAAARGAVPTGIDLAPQMVELARRRHPGIRFETGDAEALGLGDASFDAAVAGFVVNHVGRPDLLAEELARVVVPGGRVAVSVWDLPDRVPMFGELIEAAAEAGAIAPELPPAPDFFHYSDDAELLGLLEGAGLVEPRVETIEFGFRVDGVDDLWDGVLGGSVRVAAVVRAQEDGRKGRIRDAFAARVRRFERDGGLELPVAVKVGSGGSP